MNTLFGKASDMPPRSVCAAFSGHRPKGLPWGYDERAEECVSLKARLCDEIRRAYSSGIRYFLSGMAEGFDTYAAEAVLSLSGELEGIELIAVFPYGTGKDARSRGIASRAFEVISLCESHAPGCMMARNRFLVNNSSLLIAAYSGDGRSGTAATMRMAREAGISIRVLGV